MREVHKGHVHGVGMGPRLEQDTVVERELRPTPRMLSRSPATTSSWASGEMWTGVPVGVIDWTSTARVRSTVASDDPSGTPRGVFGA